MKILFNSSYWRLCILWTCKCDLQNWTQKRTMKHRKFQKPIKVEWKLQTFFYYLIDASKSAIKQFLLFNLVLVQCTRNFFKRDSSLFDAIKFIFIFFY